MSGPLQVIKLSDKKLNDVRNAREKALKHADTVVLADASTSMLWPDKRNGKDEDKSRWQIQTEIIQAIVSTAMEYDDDGIKIHIIKVSEFLGSIRVKGTTPLIQVVKEELDLQLDAIKENPSCKRLNLVVVTDGEPDTPKDESTLLSVISDAAFDIEENIPGVKAQDKIGIQFVLVTNLTKVKAYYRLLDDLEGGIRKNKKKDESGKEMEWKEDEEPKPLEADLIDVTYKSELEMMGSYNAELTIAKILAGNASTLLDDLLDEEFDDGGDKNDIDAYIKKHDLKV